MLGLQEYHELARFMLEITALPQSTAEVEHTFSKVNNNKTKLRNTVAVRTVEGIIKSSEAFTSNFEINARLHARLHGPTKLHGAIF